MRVTLSERREVTAVGSFKHLQMQCSQLLVSMGSEAD